MQRHLNAKLTQVNQAGAAGTNPGGWERGWWVEAAPGNIVLNVSPSRVPEILLLSTEQHLPMEPTWFCLPVNWSCNNQVNGGEGFLQDPAWADQSRIFVKFKHLCILLQEFYSIRGTPASISPADGELTMNQSAFSMIQLQSPELS